MMNEKRLITISHYLGCGGAYIGEKLSDMLSIPFIDQQILKKVADTLRLPEEELKSREERKASFWQTFQTLEMLSNPELGMGAVYIPSDRELFDLESEYIVELAKEGSAIILGRGGRYILRDYESHYSIFVDADMADRIERVSELYNLPADEARKLIERNDRERDSYIKTYTKLNWLDTRNYDICINTSSIGLDNSVSLLKSAIECRFS